jgi:hypothetical protein
MKRFKFRQMRYSKGMWHLLPTLVLIHNRRESYAPGDIAIHFNFLRFHCWLTYTYAGIVR